MTGPAVRSGLGALRGAGLQGALVDWSAGTLGVRLALGAGCWLARGLGSAAVRGVGELRDSRRGFVVVVLCLDAGRTGT